jgi:hypothetical protein
VNVTHYPTGGMNMAGKRTVKMVRAVGRLIVCSHVDCGDPRSGAVVNQVVAQQYVAAAIARHAATHED